MGEPCSLSVYLRGRFFQNSIDSIRMKIRFLSVWSFWCTWRTMQSYRRSQRREASAPFLAYWYSALRASICPCQICSFLLWKITQRNWFIGSRVKLFFSFTWKFLTSCTELCKKKLSQISHLDIFSCISNTSGLLNVNIPLVLKIDGSPYITKQTNMLQNNSTKHNGTNFFGNFLIFVCVRT